ncbi:MAG: membrane integrity-associated transporter subunit PqiC, partial [Burkholderiales bacterium]|nr:membrane integrity-associated transporter subunit PqiC [Burkholderiales bacterium]
MKPEPQRATPATLALALGAAALLGACAAAPVETFHTLRPPPAAWPPAPIEVAPVTLPALVDRPQWVLRDAGGAVRILEQQRWAQPLAADLAQALGEDLA